MTEQNAPDVTNHDRRLAREWAEFIEADMSAWSYRILAAARVILNDIPAPTPPTMADMTEEERHECRWMQCDAGPCGRRGLIVGTGEWAVYVTDKETGGYSNYSPDLVTALPDLPRVEWSGTEKGEDVAPVKVGDVIESAEDPRLDALPVGTVLADCDGETVAKRNEEWAGLGYIPIESEGTEFGPWTVRRIGWETYQ